MLISKGKATRIEIQLSYEEMDLLSRGEIIECRLRDQDEDLTIIEIGMSHVCHED